MNTINMPHSGRSSRSKHVEDVRAMIQQYEEQIASSEDELALSLMKQKLNGLKRLVGVKEIKNDQRQHRDAV